MIDCKSVHLWSILSRLGVIWTGKLRIQHLYNQSAKMDSFYAKECHLEDTLLEDTPPHMHQAGLSSSML